MGEWGRGMYVNKLVVHSMYFCHRITLGSYEDWILVQNKINMHPMFPHEQTNPLYEKCPPFCMHAHHLAMPTTSLMCCMTKYHWLVQAPFDKSTCKFAYLPDTPRSA